MSHLLPRNSINFVTFYSMFFFQFKSCEKNKHAVYFVSIGIVWNVPGSMRIDHLAGNKNRYRIIVLGAFNILFNGSLIRCSIVPWFVVLRLTNLWLYCSMFCNCRVVNIMQNAWLNLLLTDLANTNEWWNRTFWLLTLQHKHYPIHISFYFIHLHITSILLL